jgi:hypothetical protein
LIIGKTTIGFYNCGGISDDEMNFRSLISSIKKTTPNAAKFYEFIEDTSMHFITNGSDEKKKVKNAKKRMLEGLNPDNILSFAVDPKDHLESR